MATRDRETEEPLGDPVTHRAALSAVVGRLIEMGIDGDTLGDLAADIGDLREALDTIVLNLRRIADDDGPSAAIDAIESEARDHMPNHVRSLREAPKRLRRALNLPG